ncbi:MAG: efflux RND transporter periplasmic adaptor subunit [Kiritimatiellales bacterium]
MGENNRVLKTVLGIGLVVAGIIAAVVMIKSKPQAQRRKMSAMIPVVEAAPLSTISTSVTVSCMGTVIADREVAVQAEVTGRVSGLMPGLVEGARVRQGDLLLSIDSRDYELAVEKAEAALHSAQSSLRLEEGEQAVAKHEMELIGDEVPVDDAYRDLMLREPQLKAAQASVESAQAALSAAKLDLERSRITAPFDAVVKAVNVDAGDYALSSKTLVELVATDRFFVRTSIPVSSLAFFPDIGKTDYPAEVVLTDGAVRKGFLYKLLPNLSEQGRMARVLIAVENPMDPENGRPMLMGEAVRVELSGKEVDGVCLIDRLNFQDGSVVWMIDSDNKLHICPADVVQGYADRVLVRVAFSNDWKLVTSSIPAPVEGMTLNVIDAQEGAAE